jgi:hypothetical protein
MNGADPVPGKPDPALPLLFLHIPRTAGMTLNSLFQRTFGHDRSLLAAHWFRTDGEDLTRFSFVEGHLGTGFFREKFGEGWHANAVTLLRDPVERTVSQARHIRDIPGPAQEFLRSRVRDPAKVFERLPGLINLQTKQLSRTPIDDPHVDPSALDEAKATLERLAFGITEWFDTSVALFMERLQMNVPRFEAKNASSGTHDDDLLSDDFRAAAREHNDLDEQLYDYAVTLWRSRVASYTESLLALPTESAKLTGALRYRRQRLEKAIRVPPPGVSGTFAGWVLVDGYPADAALVRAGAEVVPLIPRVERTDAARVTQDVHKRNAGLVGRIKIPRGAQSVELIAFDRSRNRRAVRAFEVTRVGPGPLVTRLPSAFKNRAKKLLRR